MENAGVRIALTPAAPRTGDRGRIALPTAEQRGQLPITALFLASSLTAAITAGFALGTWLLLGSAIGVAAPGNAWGALVQVHGSAQLVGFAGLLVMGISYRILPRFRGGAEPAAGPVLASFALVATGLLLRPVQAWTDAPARDALLLAAGVAQLAGMVIYANVSLRILGGGTNPHRADEIFIGTGVAFGVIGSMWQLLSLAPAIGGAALVAPDAGSAAIATLLLGFAGAHVIGVSLRVAPAFIAATPAGGRAVVLAAVLWVVGVTLMAFGGPAGPGLLLLATVVVVRAVGPFGRGVAARSVPAPARLVRLAFRSAYAWLVIGLALLTAGTAADAPAHLATAGRHALALGFLTQMVFAVGSRLIPALTGGTAPSMRSVGAAIALVNLAAALRVGSEILGPAAALGAIGLALSGPIALAALLVFAAAATRTVRSAMSAA